MTTTTVEIPTSVVDAVREARAARDAAMAMAEDAAAAKELDVAAIDTAIAAYAATGDPFSANDLRHVLPEDLPSSLFGARFMAASKQRLIRKAGYVPSTKESTHAHEIRIWIGVTPS